MHSQHTTLPNDTATLETDHHFSFCYSKFLFSKNLFTLSSDRQQLAHSRYMSHAFEQQKQQPNPH